MDIVNYRMPNPLKIHPDALWISPTGQQIVVSEHLAAIQQNPEQFDLTPGDVSIRNLSREMAAAKLGNIALELVHSGWIRYRMLDLVHNFEVTAIDVAKARILAVLAKVNCPAEELVEITCITPPILTIRETVEHFMQTADTERQFPSEAHRKWSWAWSAKETDDPAK